MVSLAVTVAFSYLIAKWSLFLAGLVVFPVFTITIILLVAIVAATGVSVNEERDA